MKNKNLKSKTAISQDKLALYIEQLTSEKADLQIARDILEKITNGAVSMDLNRLGEPILIDPHTRKDITDKVVQIVLDLALSQQFKDYYNL